MARISGWKLDLERNGKVFHATPIYVLALNVVTFAFYKVDPITLVFEVRAVSPVFVEVIPPLVP